MQRAVGSAPVPSPITASAQCASGARSPEQPSEPYSCTTGVMPALSSAAYALRCLEAHAGAAGGEGGQAQQHERAHDLALDLGAGAGRVRAHERALQLGAQVDGMCRVASAPKPVETP